jgi:hypothetical protein
LGKVSVMFIVLYNANKINYRLEKIQFWCLYRKIKRVKAIKFWNTVVIDFTDKKGVFNSISSINKSNLNNKDLIRVF